MANDKQLQLKTDFMVTASADDYDAAVEYFVRPTDTVLEIGSKVGSTTKKISEKSKAVIGIDHAEDAVESARQFHPNVRFEILDAFDVLAAQNSMGGTVDVIFIDTVQLTGYSSVLDSICLLNTYAAVLKPRVVIIKNKALRSLASQCVAWDPSPKGIETAKAMQFRKETLFVATRGVDEFRASIDVWVKDTDSVLEIGCEWGTTTELIHHRAPHVIGTDVSLKCILRARTLRPDIKFEVLDGFDVRAALELGAKFDKIYIDISGLSGYRSLLDVISLLKMYETVLSPTAIVIKSGSLKHFARHYIAWSRPKATEIF